MIAAGREMLAHCEGAWSVAERCWGRRLFGLPVDRGPVLAATQPADQADYATGDDFRNVDWQRAARLDELVTRQRRGVETGTVEIVLDRSRSMTIGSPPKFDMAQELAAALGYFALAAGRRVRLARRTASGEAYRARRDFSRLLAEVQEQVADQAEDQLGADLTQAARRLRRGDVVIVLSDLLQADGVTRLVAPLARPAEQLLMVQVLAAEDLEPAWLEGFGLREVERGSVRKTDLTEADLSRYRAAAAEFCRQTRESLQARGIPIVQVRSDVGFLRALEFLIHVLGQPR